MVDWRFCYYRNPLILLFVFTIFPLILFLIVYLVEVMSFCNSSGWKVQGSRLIGFQQI